MNKLTSFDTNFAESFRSRGRNATSDEASNALVQRNEAKGPYQSRLIEILEGFKLSTAARLVATEIQKTFNPLACPNSAASNPMLVMQYLRENTQEMTEATNELLSFLTLLRGWDGPDSLPPSRSAVADAYDFVLRLAQNVEVPDPTVYADGQVGWFWKKGDDVISIVFEGDGRYAYFGKVKGNIARSPSRQYGTAIPQDLGRVIDAI